MSIWFVWHEWQNGPGPYIVGRRSLLCDAGGTYERRRRIVLKAGYIPRLANDRELRCSSCMAGSSETISPLSS